MLVIEYTLTQSVSLSTGRFRGCERRYLEFGAAAMPARMSAMTGHGEMGESGLFSRFGEDVMFPHS
jgi:hypothetical protein